MLGVGSLTANADEAAEDTKILLVLDASGSMKGDDPSGSTKLKAAKKALTTAISTLPADAQVGLRVYGATYPGKDRKLSCVDTQLAHPVGPLDVAGLTTQINAVKAQGDTPIAYSLEKAVDDLGTEGKRHIILVSDGEENCDPDPCAVVKKLVDKDVSIQVDTVGYAVDKKARNQLQCIAEAGKGTCSPAPPSPFPLIPAPSTSTRTSRPAPTRPTSCCSSSAAPRSRPSRCPSRSWSSRRTLSPTSPPCPRASPTSPPARRVWSIRPPARP
ncbi:MAG: VWA domain-containing protein [Propionibacteriaceae bacterium]|nr:VWA domain-containing protein [Propionibacteriaceae bacterium]